MTTEEKKTFTAFITTNIVGVLALIGSILWTTYNSGTASASEVAKIKADVVNLSARQDKAENSIQNSLLRNQVEHDKLSDKLDEVKTLIINLK